MKQMYMLFFGLLVLILTGCSDHDWADTNTDKPVKVTAQIAKSRVGFNEVDNITNAYWQEGDAITLFTSSQGNLDYVAGASAGSSSSKAFTPRSGYLKAIDGEQVLACYPASTIEDGKVSLPITTYWEDNDPMPFAYAVSSIQDSEVNLQFEHVFSFLKLTVTPSMLSDTTKAVRQLIVRTSSGAPLSIGEGSTFDYSTKKASIANGENTIQIATDTKVVRTSWEVYLPVLPQPADADITITLADEAGEILFELTKKTPSTGLEKGNVYRVGTSISYDTSFLIDGPTFNTRIKQLANDADITYTDADSLIRNIEFVTDTELMTSLDDCIEVSSSDSPCPIYASFNSTERLLTVFTPAKDIEIEDASFMFFALCSLQSIDFGNFDVNEKTVTTHHMFFSCYSLNEVDVSGWDTRNVTTMENMFLGCSSLTDLDVSNWVASNVTAMHGMFASCTSLATVNMANWSIGEEASIDYLFDGCTSLTSANLSKWSIGNKTFISQLFEDCSALTTLDVSNWTVGDGVVMERIFANSPALTTVSISDWNIGDKSMNLYMFMGCSALSTINVSNWTIGDEATIKTFAECSLKTIELSDWTIGENANLSEMFYNCSSLTTLNTSNWDISNAINMSLMFALCPSLKTLDASNWNTGNVTDMNSMFGGCSSLTNLNLSNWDTSKVSKMNFMFDECSSLTNLNLSNWDTSKVSKMNFMFDGCSSLSNLDLSNWVTSNVTDMYSMFDGCSSLSNLDLSNWVTSNVTDMGSMFYGCSSLTNLNLSNWVTSNVTDMRYMFCACSSLTNLNLSNWVISNVTDTNNMFWGCASSSQACRITTKQETKEFLLSNTDNTNMNPAWFIWGDAASDGSSFDTVPKEDW